MRFLMEILDKLKFFGEAVAVTSDQTLKSTENTHLYTRCDRNVTSSSIVYITIQ